LSHALSAAGVPHRIESIALRGEFGRSAYLAGHLYASYGLTAGAMVESAQRLIGKK